MKELKCNINFDIIGRIINISAPEDILDDNEMDAVKHLINHGEIEHLLCYSNAFKVAQALSDIYDCDYGIVEGYSCDTRIKRNYVGSPCWHVINYIQIQGKIYYFDLTSLLYPDQKSPNFFALRRYGLDDAHKLVDTFGHPFPTHILNYRDDYKYPFYFNSTGAQIVVESKPSSVFDIEPFLKKMYYSIFNKKTTQYVLDVLEQTMETSPFYKKINEQN